MFLNKFETVFNWSVNIREKFIDGGWKSDGQLTGSDFCQFLLGFQGHEVGMG